MSDRWLVVVNPAAGRGEAAPDLLEQQFRALGAEADVVVPDGIDNLRTAVADAAGSGAGIAVVGGDGTLHQAVNAVAGMSRRPRMGVIPAGTGSDFARMFAIPDGIPAAVERVVHGRDYRVDVGLVEGHWGSRYFINVAETGVTAASLVAAHRLPARMGPARYSVGFWLTLPRFRRTQLRVTAGSRVYEGEGIAVVMANGQFFGGGFHVAPRATVVDGVADVQVFAARRLDALPIFQQVRRGLHLKNPKVRRFSSETFSVEADRPWPVEADGEVFGHLPVQGRMIRAHLEFRV